MEKQDKTRLLLSVQEHLEQYTDEQLQQMIADDPELAGQLEQLALTKQALVKHEVDEEAVPVEEEWQKFAAEHADELETLEKATIKAHPKGKKLLNILPYKMAASIIGIVFTAGVAFAAIHIVRHVVGGDSPVGGDLKSSTQEVRISNPPQQKTDTTTNAKPIVFDNVALDMMLPQIAAYYSSGDSKSPIRVEFLNDDARSLRFYFVWKQDETLDVVLHRLNLFESITVELKSDKIVVE